MGSSRLLSLDKQGIGLQGVAGSTAVPQPHAAWAYQTGCETAHSGGHPKFWPLLFTELTAIQPWSCPHLDLGVCFGNQIVDRERKYYTLRIVFNRRRMRLRRWMEQVPTCHCGRSQWQQHCGCTLASGHGSVRGKPSQMLGMEQGHQNESVQIQNPHCFLSRCPLLWSRKWHMVPLNFHKSKYTCLFLQAFLCLSNSECHLLIANNSVLFYMHLQS